MSAPAQVALAALLLLLLCLQPPPASAAVASIPSIAVAPYLKPENGLLQGTQSTTAINYTIVSYRVVGEQAANLSALAPALGAALTEVYGALNVSATYIYISPAASAPTTNVSGSSGGRRLRRLLQAVLPAQSRQQQYSLTSVGKHGRVDSVQRRSLQQVSSSALAGAELNVTLGATASSQLPQPATAQPALESALSAALSMNGFPGLTWVTLNQSVTEVGALLLTVVPIANSTGATVTFEASGANAVPFTVQKQSDLLVALGNASAASGSGVSLGFARVSGVVQNTTAGTADVMVLLQTAVVAGQDAITALLPVLLAAEAAAETALGIPKIRTKNLQSAAGISVTDQVAVIDAALRAAATPTPTPAPAPISSAHSLAVGVYVGIAVGVAVVALLLCLVGCFVVRSRGKQVAGPVDISKYSGTTASTQPPRPPKDGYAATAALNGTNGVPLEKPKMQDSADSLNIPSAALKDTFANQIALQERAASLASSDGGGGGGGAFGGGTFSSAPSRASSDGMSTARTLGPSPAASVAPSSARSMQQGPWTPVGRSGTATPMSGIIGGGAARSTSSELNEQFGHMGRFTSLASNYSTGSAPIDNQVSGWDVDPASIVILKREDGSDWQLGAGSFGTVYKAVRDGVQDVAVKKLIDSEDVQLTRFIKEISILKGLSFDRNIVQFYGACLQPSPMLVLEFMEGGDLRQAMNKDEGRELGWYGKGKDIALDIARGLVFLHNNNVVHNDLKSKNILLDKVWSVAKIADVGLARIMSSAYMSEGSRAHGTFAYAAPELLLNKRCDSKVDVFSYGVVLWEIVTQESPQRGQLREPRVPEECPTEVADLIDVCIRTDPRKRPTATQLFHLIKAIGRDPNDPISAPVSTSTSEYNPDLDSTRTSASAPPGTPSAWNPSEFARQGEPPSSGSVTPMGSFTPMSSVNTPTGVLGQAGKGGSGFGARGSHGLGDEAIAEEDPVE